MDACCSNFITKQSRIYLDFVKDMSNPYPGETMVLEVAKTALEKCSTGLDAVLTTFSDQTSDIKNISKEPLINIFNTCSEKLSTAPVLPVETSTALIASESVNASTRIFTALSTGASTIKAGLSNAVTSVATHANIAAQALMTKEVLIPITITVGMVAIAAITYNMLSKPSQTQTKESIQPPPLVGPISQNTADRIAILFEQAQRTE